MRSIFGYFLKKTENFSVFLVAQKVCLILRHTFFWKNDFLKKVTQKSSFFLRRFFRAKCTFQFSKNVYFYVFWDSGADAFHFFQKTDLFWGSVFWDAGASRFWRLGRLRRPSKARHLTVFTESTGGRRFSWKTLLSAYFNLSLSIGFRL